MFSGFILIHFPGAICLLVVCPATPLKSWEVHSASSYITCTSCPSSFGYLSKITEFYFDFQDSCCIYISVFLVSWKTHHISSQRGRKVISQERGSWWGDEEAEGIFEYLCLSVWFTDTSTQQCSVVSFVTVAASRKSGLSYFGNNSALSSDGILNWKIQLLVNNTLNTTSIYKVTARKASTVFHREAC